MYATIALADIIIHAREDDIVVKAEFYDPVSGDNETLLMSHAQFGAIIAMAVVGDIQSIKEVQELIYSFDEAALEEVPQHLRPIS